MIKKYLNRGGKRQVQDLLKLQGRGGPLYNEEYRNPSADRVAAAAQHWSENRGAAEWAMDEERARRSDRIWLMQQI